MGLKEPYILFTLAEFGTYTYLFNVSEILTELSFNLTSGQIRRERVENMDSEHRETTAAVRKDFPKRNIRRGGTASRQTMREVNASEVPVYDSRCRCQVRMIKILREITRCMSHVN